MASFSDSKAAELVQRSGVVGVFASGIPVPGGIVGCADIVFHDSPPLAGWALGALLRIVSFARCRVTSVTLAQSNVF
jgi:hypothetical protein